MSGDSVRVPDEFKNLKDLELVLKFKGPSSLGELSAARKISGLKVASSSPELQRLMIMLQALEKQKNYSRLLVIFEAIMGKYGENPEILNAYAWTLATCEDKKLRNPKKAIKLARKAVELTQNKNGAILDTLAVALYADGQLAEAVKYIKIAAKKCPNIPEVQQRAKEYEKELKGKP